MTWTVDLSAMEAVHASGLRVKFKWRDGGWDGSPLKPLPSAVTPDNAARLMREAADAFTEILRASAAKYRCQRCGHGWNPRFDERPRICPDCKSPYWDRPRR